MSQLTQTVESFPPDAGEEEEDSSGDESDTESSSEIDERDRLLAKGKQEMEKTQVKEYSQPKKKKTNYFSRNYMFHL